MSSFDVFLSYAHADQEPDSMNPGYTTNKPGAVQSSETAVATLAGRLDEYDADLSDLQRTVDQFASSFAAIDTIMWSEQPPDQPER